MSKAEDLSTKTPDELGALLLDLKKQQLNLRFQRSQGQLENTAQIRNTRREIARVHTFLSRRTADSAASKQPSAKKAPKDKAAKKTGKKDAA